MKYILYFRNFRVIDLSADLSIVSACSFHNHRRPNKSRARRKTAFVSKPSSIFKHNKQCEKSRRRKEFSVFTSEIARPMKSGTSRSTVSYFSPSSAKAGGGLGSFSSMLQRLQTRLRTFVVFASKVWTFICYVFRKQTRSVSDFPSFFVYHCVLTEKIVEFCRKIIQELFLLFNRF